MKRLLLPLLLLSSLLQAQVVPDSALMRSNPYQAIYEAQSQAVALGTTVDYSLWRDSLIRMQIPQGAKSIPLACENDFCNMVLEVTNTSHQLYLFAHSNPATPIELSPEQVDSGLFPQLDSGAYLLILKDENPWTVRVSYGYNVFRQDLLFVQDGSAMNRPVMPYGSPATQMKASIVPITRSADLLFQNLHLRRTPESTRQTRLLSLSNLCNVRLTNLSVATPQYQPFRSRVTDSLPATPSSVTSRLRTPHKLEHDEVIALSHCALVEINDVVIDGTYTVPGSYGYALSVNNTYRLSCHRVMADANWGVFGSNNMSVTSLQGCLLNRFDIHCYGRDVFASGCTFFGKQTQFSSFYGTLKFDGCLFDDCIPVRIRGDYNAHTPFDIYMIDCTFRATNKNRSLVNVILQDTSVNPRPELAERQLPRLHVEGLRVQKSPIVPKVRSYHLTGDRRACKEAQSLLPTPL